jgi:hypothetical protein
MTECMRSRKTKLQIDPWFWLVVNSDTQSLTHKFFWHLELVEVCLFVCLFVCLSVKNKWKPTVKTSSSFWFRLFKSMKGTFFYQFFSKNWQMIRSRTKSHERWNESEKSLKRLYPPQFIFVFLNLWTNIWGPHNMNISPWWINWNSWLHLSQVQHSQV